MSELLEFLSNGEHPVAMPRYANAQELRESLSRNYALIRFTDTRGAAELGVPLDRSKCDLTRADFEAGQGEVRLVGRLNLDFTEVECEATVDLGSMTGTGRLRLLAVAV
jgi:hypothetical protein